MKRLPIKVHVYFWTLPIETKYVHKGGEWKKTGEETAVDNKGKEWKFEAHHGCIIDKELADKIRIEKHGYRPIA